MHFFLFFCSRLDTRVWFWFNLSWSWLFWVTGWTGVSPARSDIMFLGERGRSDRETEVGECRAT